MNIITNILNKAGSSSTYINSVSEWLKKQSAIYNDKLNDIINGVNDDPFIAGNNVISAQKLREIVEGEIEDGRVYVDEIGEQYTTNAIITSISNQNSVFIIKACALEALAAGQTPVECNSIFFNNLSVQLGDITVDNNAYCSYISSILLSSGSAASKVRQIITGDMPSQAGFTNTASEEFTGINPFLGFCNNITVDWTEPLIAVTRVRVLEWYVLQKVYEGLLAPAASWIKRKSVGVAKAIANPIDVENVEGGQDLSFIDGYYQILLNIPGPADWVAEHKNQYCCIVILGATVYLHISDEGIDYMYVKKHLYDPEIATAIYNAFSSSNPSDWTKVEAVINSSAEFRAEIKEDSDELFLYKGMLQTEKLIYAGMHLAAGHSVDYFVRDYSPEDFNPMISAMTNTSIPIDNTLTVNNALWVDELNKGHVEDYQESFRTLVIAMVDNLASSESFYPYSWVDGPLQGSYSVRTDIENIESVSNIVKTFVTAVVIVVAGVVAVKSLLKIKTMAKAAMRQYELAYYNPAVDATTLKKLRRKANILQTLSGSSFRIPSYINASNSDNDELVRLIRG